MKLPYENASSGQKAINDIQIILKSFGCTKFATGEDFETGEVFIQFEHNGRPVNLKASAKGYAAAWLKRNPWNTKRRCSGEEHNSRALTKGSLAVYSVLRDWVKGQVTAIEIGVLTFESAFLSHMLLPDGKRVIEAIQERKLLPEYKSER